MIEIQNIEFRSIIENRKMSENSQHIAVHNVLIITSATLSVSQQNRLENKVSKITKITANNCGQTVLKATLTMGQPLNHLPAVFGFLILILASFSTLSFSSSSSMSSSSPTLFLFIHTVLEIL